MPLLVLIGGPRDGQEFKTKTIISRELLVRAEEPYERLGFGAKPPYYVYMWEREVEGLNNRKENRYRFEKIVQSVETKEEKEPEDEPS